MAPTSERAATSHTSSLQGRHVAVVHGGIVAAGSRCREALFGLSAFGCLVAVSPSRGQTSDTKRFRAPKHVDASAVCLGSKLSCAWATIAMHINTATPRRETDPTAEGRKEPQRSGFRQKVTLDEPGCSEAHVRRGCIFLGAD